MNWWLTLITRRSRKDTSSWSMESWRMESCRMERAGFIATGRVSNGRRRAMERASSILVRVLMGAALFSILSGTKCLANRNERSEEENLMDYLFDGYNPSARPVLNSSATVNVKLQFSLLQIQDLNVRNQVLTTTGLLILDWTDERLAWTSEVSELDEIVVHGESIWRPEFAVINGAESIYGEYKEFQAVLRSDGAVRWEPGGVFKTMCGIDITYYPFDEQSCDLTFGAWSYYTTKMNLSTDSVSINLDTYEKNGEWQITNTAAARGEFHFECCPHQKFSNIGFTIDLRRRHTFYIMNVILPGILTSAVLLSIFFCIPAQKIHIGVAALFSFRLFLVNVSDTIPRTSDHVPLLGIYLACTMAITTLAMVATVIVGNIYEIKDRPVPRWARRLFMVHVARVLCMCNCFAPPVDSPDGATESLSGIERNCNYSDEADSKKSSKFRIVTFLNPSARRRTRSRDVRSTSCDGGRGERTRAKSSGGAGVRGTNRWRDDEDNEQRGAVVYFNSGSKDHRNNSMGFSPITHTFSSGLASSYQHGGSVVGSRVGTDDNPGTEMGSGGEELNHRTTMTIEPTEPVKVNYARDWAHVAAVCDRFFFWLCLVFIVATTLLLFHPLSTTSLAAKGQTGVHI